MILPASNANRWSRCGGSATLEAAHQPPDSAKRRASQAAHWVASERFLARAHPAGTLAPNGVPVDQEMIDSAEVFYDAVHADIARCGPERWVRADVELTMHKLVHPYVQGKADMAISDLTNHRLIIWNYYYGHGFVDAFDNRQLVLYAAGVIEGHDLTFNDIKGWEIELGVVQPRNFHRTGPVRKWSMLGHQLWAHIDLLRQAAIIAVSPSAACVTSDQCDNCTARHACAPLQRSAAIAVDISGENTPLELSDHALGLELMQLTAAKDRLEARLTGLQQVALAKLRSGTAVPFWTTHQGDGNEKWIKPEAEVSALGQMLGVPLTKSGTLTPTQARAAFKKAGLDAGVISAYADRPKGEVKLTALDDSTAAKAFQR